MVDIKWDQRFLELAKLVSTWSKDPSTKVGAVITDDRRIISVGYNGFPEGVLDSSERYSNREIKYKYMVHAERNALLFANTSLKNTTLYTYPFMPCSECAGMIIQSGIKRVVTLINTNERWKESFEITKNMFDEAGVSLTQYSKNIFFN
jgi:dCMP deaminase